MPDEPSEVGEPRRRVALNDSCTNVLKGYPLCPPLANAAFGYGADVGNEAEKAVVGQFQRLGDVNQLSRPIGDIIRGCSRRVDERSPGKASDRRRHGKLKGSRL